MICLDRNRYSDALDVYRKGELFFPLVATVLLEKQNGVVYADSTEIPRQFYVEHSFGFAQVFGEQNPFFEQELEKYLLVEGCFHSNKVRLYSPRVADFLKVDHKKSSLSTRQRFRLGDVFVRAENVLFEIPNRDDVEISLVDLNNVRLIEEKFGVVGRFWRSPDEFITHSEAVVVQYKGEVASICYSAATADHCAEIDVMTLPEFRKLGLGKLAVARFIEVCRQHAIEPLWDCFANNTPSMMLAESIGYQAMGKPYSFYTIDR